jgi:acyl-coenzyme A thioesterase PaaI-like protein
MAPSDITAPFLRIPWTAALLSKPNLVVRVPDSRNLKPRKEDSLFATTLKTPATIRSCINIYPRPETSDPYIQGITTLATLGSALDGHPGILHSCIVASLLNEAMGILQNVNHERDHFLAVGRGLAEGESPASELGSFTALLNVKYLRPVRTRAAVQVVAWYVGRESRTQWINAEIRQPVDGGGEDDYGEVVVCASGEGLFVVPRESKV